MYAFEDGETVSIQLRSKVKVGADFIYILEEELFLFNEFDKTTVAHSLSIWMVCQKIS